jgi:hypothetical protein
MVGYTVWALDVIRASSTRGLEFQNGVAAILSGVVLLLPPASFAISPSYALFAEWAPESIWGVSVMGVGVAQVAATLHDVVPMRRIASAILCVLFCILGGGILWSNPLSVVAPMILAMAAGQVGAFWQARRVP